MNRVGRQRIKTVGGWNQNEITRSRPSQGDRRAWTRDSYKKLGTRIETLTGKMDYRTMHVDIKKDLPRLHPGVNDLVRVLEKQAHCFSWALSEPACPKSLLTYSESKYHKNCVSPKKGRSSDSLSRLSSLSSPIQPDTYFYDRFFYRQYPDRDSEYQEIEEKYNAIKRHKLDYSPPECNEDKIRALISEPTLESKTKMYDGLSGHYAQYRSFPVKSSTGWKGYPPGKLNSSGQDDEYHPSSILKNPLGSGSRIKMVSEGGSVPCFELTEIRDLLKKSDPETIRRMQEMLTLMKELSVRGICMARCDGGTLITNEASEEQSFMSPGLNKRPQKRDDSRRRNEEPDDYDRPQSWKTLRRTTEDAEVVGAKDPKQSCRLSAKLSVESSIPQGSNRSFRRGEKVFSPQGSKKGYSFNDKDSRKREDEEDYDFGDDVQRQESDTYQKPSQKGKRGSKYGRRGESTRRGKKKRDDPTESSSSLSEYSTGGSQSYFRSGKGEADLESSGVGDKSHRSLGKQSSAKRKLKTARKEDFSSSDSSISMQGSTSSMSRSRDYNQDPRVSKQSVVRSKYSSGSDQGGLGSRGNAKLTAGKNQLTVNEVLELSNKIADMTVLQIMDELIEKGLYVPPSIRYEPGRVATDRPTISQQSGGPSSFPTQPRFDQTSKAGSIKRLDRIDESSSRSGSSKISLKKPDGSTRCGEKGEKRGSQESKKSYCPRHNRSLSPSASGRAHSPSCRFEVERERARPTGPRSQRVYQVQWADPAAFGY